MLKFVDFDDADAAAALRGFYIAVAQKDCISLQPDNFFVFDLIDCAVHHIDGSYLGKLTDVLETGSNDVYVVSLEDGKNDILIPALKSVVKDVQISEKRIVVDFESE